jgi:hypothetical protein
MYSPQALVIVGQVEHVQPQRKQFFIMILVQVLMRGKRTVAQLLGRELPTAPHQCATGAWDASRCMCVLETVMCTLGCTCMGRP